MLDFARQAGLSDPGRTCDTDTLWADAAFWRLAARPAGEGFGSPEAREAVRLREATILRQIGCEPTNGLAWADLADVRSLDGWSEAIERYLALSQLYAPYEGEAVRMRLKTLAGHGRGLGERATELARKDFSTMLHYATPEEAAGVVRDLGSDLGDWARIQLRNLTPERREAVEGVLGRQQESP